MFNIHTLRIICLSLALPISAYATEADSSKSTTAATTSAEAESKVDKSSQTKVFHCPDPRTFTYVKEGPSFAQKSLIVAERDGIKYAARDEEKGIRSKLDESAPKGKQIVLLETPKLATIYLEGYMGSGIRCTYYLYDNETGKVTGTYVKLSGSSEQLNSRCTIPGGREVGGGNWARGGFENTPELCPADNPDDCRVECPNSD